MNTLLEWALLYASKGWYVFPCREKPSNPFYKDGKQIISKEKAPYISNGFKQATTDPTLITEWWKKWTNALIGVACGESNLFVVDVDIKHGHNGINNYMQLGISDKDALHSRTPSGGLHFVFSGQGRTKTNILNGIDTRGKGGYFIAPPSIIYNNEKSGKYIALDDWTRTPCSIPDAILEKFNLTNHRVKRSNFVDTTSTEEKVLKAKEALDKLSLDKNDDYQTWIGVGMSLYSLGDAGLKLWIDWSKKSKKYEDGVCERKWDTLHPSQITLGSLFFYSKQEGVNIGK